LVVAHRMAQLLKQGADAPCQQLQLLDFHCLLQGDISDARIAGRPWKNKRKGLGLREFRLRHALKGACGR
jgi:hypothetical protein